MFEFGHPIQNLSGQQRLREHPLTLKKLFSEKPTGFSSEGCKGGNGFEPALWYFEEGEGVFLGVSGNGRVKGSCFAPCKCCAMNRTQKGPTPFWIHHDQWSSAVTAERSTLLKHNPVPNPHSSITVALPSTPMERFTVRPEPWDRWEVPFKTV